MEHGSVSLLLPSFVQRSARGRAMIAITRRILKGAVIVHADVVAIALLNVHAVLVHGSHGTRGEKAMLL